MPRQLASPSVAMSNQIEHPQVAGTASRAWEGWHPDPDLEAAHSAIESAIDAASVQGLNVVGFGEVSLAVAWPAIEPRHVVKRLPSFSSRSRFEAYAALLEENLSALAERGVPHVPTALRAIGAGPGTVHGYLIQPYLPSASLASELVRHGSEDEARQTLRQVMTYVLNAAGPTLGIDAQLPNWAEFDGALAILDVSTPFMRTRDGRERLDLGLFGSPYPAALWPPLERWVLPGVLDTYYDPRSVIRDVGGNMLRQRLDARLGWWLEEANSRLEQPISEREVRDYFRSDARTWALLQRLRRLDGWWQRRVRQRPYPFLLPPRYDSRTDYTGDLGSGA
jgi:uncharacterized protein DUF6206